MNTKTLTLSAFALIVVIAIIVVANMSSSKGPSKDSLQFFQGLTAQTVGSFQVTDKDGSVKILKKGEVWAVTSVKASSDTGAPVMGGAQPSSASKEYPCDSAAVASAVEKLTGMKRDILVSENAEKQSLFEVDSAKGMKVQVWNDKGKDLGVAIIGKNAADWSSHYVRTQGTAKVYSCPGSIRYAFFSDIKRWRDKSVLRFDKAAAKKIVIQKQAMTINLELSTDTSSAGSWTLVGDGKAKTDEVNKILDNLSALNSTDWAEDTSVSDSAMGFTKPEAVVSVQLKNGDTKKITIGVKQANASVNYVKAEGKADVFLVPDYVIKNFDATPALLKDTTAVAAAAPMTPVSPAAPATK